jgi:tetratricopeptide (TPR) repeat protein
LRELFRGYRFPDDHEVLGFADIADYYGTLSGRLGFDIDIPERALVLAADKLSRSGAVDAAMEVLASLVQMYPASVDGHWRLANLHRERGDYSAALKHYRKCLEIIPNMRPAREWIDRLEAQE